MKKLILLLILLSSISAFSQAKDSTEIFKPRVFSKPVPVVEYEIVQSVVKHSSRQYEVITKLYTLRQGQIFFEIFAKWENLTRQSGEVEVVKKYQMAQVEKELKIISHHE